MSGIEVWTPAERLLANIARAGYESIDEFIARLRVDPMADTVELPAVTDFWDVPRKQAS
ncbi:hypothetical protein [Nocardia bovistercoris]|uniref:Uncharacterized protein n=1 Tax=Nocardia bovistercoris TaxID=2785916 RepID=A0A931I9U4_9NOCA|nr:hypothetical protein [Nocardia bovistercoris]MBH0776548.1 hypothetical protein [Nocardia bovistercoris]